MVQEVVITYQWKDKNYSKGNITIMNTEENKNHVEPYGRLVIECYGKPNTPDDYLFQRGVIKSILALYRLVTTRSGGDLFKELEQGGKEGQSGTTFKWHFETNEN